MYIYIYDSQIVHHNTCFDLFILRNNSFDNQGSEMKKKRHFFTFRHTVFYQNFLPTLVAIELRVLKVNAQQIHYQSKYMSFILTQSSGK